MYGGEFDGNAAFAGGGFMPSQATTQAPDFASSSKVWPLFAIEEFDKSFPRFCAIENLSIAIQILPKFSLTFALFVCIMHPILSISSRF
ncbi:unnamed protein product [Thlaspi arvense]|uniref:Uncharacterized protein n=1 Tax=Thlaspi arvense TaxID=13288 RepID=A0AAU9S1N0_THLAR|nr:unnamed protein product [Thlaspi arvense]